MHSSWETPTRAEELVNSGLQMGIETGQPDTLTLYGGQFVRVRLQQGRLGELVDLLADTAKQNPGLPVFSAVLGEALLEAGNEREALGILEKATASGFELPLKFLVDQRTRLLRTDCHGVGFSPGSRAAAQDPLPPPRLCPIRRC